MSHHNDRFFDDEQIQRYDANTIQTRYGDNWKSLATNVREITQQDGSIVKEYIIEDPALLQQMQTSSRTIDSTSSTTVSDDDQQHYYHQQPQATSKNKFAEIKAKFEQQHSSHVMGSPSTSSAAISNTTATTRQNSHKQSDDLYAKHRRGSNESLPMNRTASENESGHSSHQSRATQNLSNQYNQSQSISSDKSKATSFRRFDSADEADEEVRRIHRQGEELRRHSQESSPISSSNEIPTKSRVQYEVVDEDGNPLAIQGIHNLIQMSGVRAREVPQADGTMVKEYVIDDPQLLSKFRSQQSEHSSPMTSSYSQQPISSNDAPPPPPRIPLRQPILFRQGPSSMSDHLPLNIQQIHVLEPQRRYEYVTSAGRRIQFLITNIDELRGQPITDSDIRELTNAINTRHLPTSTNTAAVSQPSAQTQFTLPKPWYPSVDLTQRTPSNRQRIGSDTQPVSNDSQRNAFQQIPADLTRSASYGALNQGSYVSQTQQQAFNQPIIDWTPYQQQNPHGQLDQHIARQISQQRHQNTGTFQTSAQFLPQQQQQQQQQQRQQAILTRPTNSPPTNNNPPVFYQQSTAYPYQGQQQHQHGIRHVNNNAYEFNQARIDDGHTRI